MSVFLITYDLNKESDNRDREGLLKKIREFGYARLSESSYAVTTSLTASQVFDQVKPFLDKNDYLLVIPLYKPYRGFHLQQVIDWLDKYL
jgi:CRISPR-associated endonuclease Cas2